MLNLLNLKATRNSFVGLTTTLLILTSVTSSSLAKPSNWSYRIGDNLRFDFKGCTKSTNVEDVICVENFRSKNGEVGLSLSPGSVDRKSISIPDSQNNLIFDSHISDISGKIISFSYFRLALNQNREVICGSGSTTYVRAETKRFHVNICGDSNSPKLYVGSSKTGQAIVLPLKSYSSGQYIATSGDIKYSLNSRYLTVTRNGKIIRREAVLSWR
jgi:hypothetical protein